MEYNATPDGRIFNDRKIGNFNFKTHLIQAILIDFKDAIPNGPIANFKNADCEFKSGVSIQDILQYLRRRCD